MRTRTRRGGPELCSSKAHTIYPATGTMGLALPTLLITLGRTCRHRNIGVENFQLGELLGDIVMRSDPDIPKDTLLQQVFWHLFL